MDARRRELLPLFPATVRRVEPRQEPWTWWRTVLVAAPPCWGFALAVEGLTMHALAVATGDLEVAPFGVRIAMYALLLPVLLVACRAAAAVGLQRPRAPRVAAQIGIALAFAVLQRPALALAAELVGSEDLAAGVATSIRHPTAAVLAVWGAAGAAMAMNYALCVGVVAGLKSWQDLTDERVRRVEVERQATEARLEALTRQLNPHFLFNALNTVVALIGSDPPRATTLVLRISDLLRRVLRTEATRFVPLRTELDLIEDYLGIQELRHGNRLCHAIDLEPAAAAALVPPLILQPIVENAVVHGLRAPVSSVVVRIEGRLDGGVLRMLVTNPGPPQTAEDRTRRGIGLRNVHGRLDTLFRDGAGVELRTDGAGHYVTALSIPQTGGAGVGP